MYMYTVYMYKYIHVVQCNSMQCNAMQMQCNANAMSLNLSDLFDSGENMTFHWFIPLLMNISSPVLGALVSVHTWDQIGKKRMIYY